MIEETYEAKERLAKEIIKKAEAIKDWISVALKYPIKLAPDSDDNVFLTLFQAQLEELNECTVYIGYNYQY